MKYLSNKIVHYSNFIVYPLIPHPSSFIPYFMFRIIQEFNQAEEEINPALKLTWQLKDLERQNQLELADLLHLQPQLEEAIKQGENLISQTNKILQQLQQAQPIPSPFSLFI